MNGEGTDGERQANGRFAKGNPGGPGGARKRSFVLREAAESAITPEHVAALMRKALRMGLEGNLTAMRLVLDRSCGRPADVATSAEPLDLALPPMGTAKECSAALEQVANALTYVYSNWGNNGTEVLPAMVKEVRATVPPPAAAPGAH